MSGSPACVSAISFCTFACFDAVLRCGIASFRGESIATGAVKASLRNSVVNRWLSCDAGFCCVILGEEHVGGGDGDGRAGGGGESAVRRDGISPGA